MITPSPVNEGFEYHEQLGPAADGKPLLAYLSQRYTHSTPAEWAERIAAGLVLIDSRPVAAEFVLRAGSELAWLRPPWTEPEVPLDYSILYEDDDLLAVDKPAGLPTLPGANFLNSTLLNLVRAHAPDAAPVHRLGRWTSGIVLCARNQAARLHLMQQWSEHTVGKRYRALACGLPPWEEQTISAPIGTVPHVLLGTIHAATADGKPSISHITVLERRADSFLCDVRIDTGRPHQIRIHLAAAGHPLVGDPLYGIGGLPLPDTRAVPGDPGYHLHAAELSFIHPATGLGMAIESFTPLLLRVPR